jgi:hypothetical protein
MTLVTCFTAQPTRVEINAKTMRGLWFRIPLDTCWNLMEKCHMLYDLDVNLNPQRQI